MRVDIDENDAWRFQPCAPAMAFVRGNPDLKVPVRYERTDPDVVPRVLLTGDSLKKGDAHIIRNAGGIVTDDTLRSLLVSHYLLGTEEFMLIKSYRLRIDEYERRGFAKPNPESHGNRCCCSRLFLQLPKH